MSKPKTIASALLAIIGWGVLGVVVGAAGGYVMFVKQPAVFESSGVVQIARSSDDSPGISQSQLGTDPQSQTSIDPQSQIGVVANDGAASGTTGSGDAMLLQSLPILTRAVGIGNLLDLRELPSAAGRERTADKLAEAIQLSGALHVERAGQGETGQAYRIRYQASTPTAAQRVVDAVMESTRRWLLETDTSGDWQEAVQLLTSTRREIESRVDQVESELAAGATDPDTQQAATIDGATVSAAAEQHRLLRQRAYELQQQRTLLGEKLRRSESLIQQGAPVGTILASLNLPLPATVPRSAPTDTRDARDEPEPDTENEQQRALAKRLELERDVERQVKPLQAELDQLLQKLGSKHPTVVHLKSQIDRLRKPLADLPPLSTLTEASSTTTDTSAASTETDAAPDSDGKIDPAAARKIVSSLKSLRSEKKSVDEQFRQLSSRLEKSASEVAAQEKALSERNRVLERLQEQQRLLTQTSSRLQQLSSSPPFPSVRLTILQPPTAAVQVAPDLEFHLLRGAIIGGCIGLTVIALLLLTSLATHE